MSGWTSKAASHWSKNIWSTADGEETRLGGSSKNIMTDGGTMIDKETGQVLGLEVDSMYWKDKF